MQTDELRAELADLQREVGPFTGDLAAVRRRVTRRRVAITSVAVILAVGVTASVVATTRTGTHHVEIAGRSKTTTLEALPRLDAFVVLPPHASSADTADVKAILDGTPAVELYASIPAGFVESKIGHVPKQLETATVRAFASSLGTSLSFGVELDRAVPDALQQLTSALGSDASVHDYHALSVKPADDDVEVFMPVDACNSQIKNVQIILEHDADIVSWRFVTHDDAYTAFKKLFSDQPNLIKNTTPQQLPTSFQLEVRDGVPPITAARRLRNVAGVNSVIVEANPFSATTTYLFPDNPSDACLAKP